MGRRRTIDRDQLLDAAEAVIAREGAAGLTIDAVAKEMGITKGGVQYCFGTTFAIRRLRSGSGNVRRVCNESVPWRPCPGFPRARPRPVATGPGPLGTLLATGCRRTKSRPDRATR